LLLIAVQGRVQASLEAVAGVNVGAQRLHVIVAEPGLIVPFPRFMEASEVEPQFVVLRAMREEVRGEVHEEVLVTATDANQTSSKDD
jgi:hypothetical protein